MALPLAPRQQQPACLIATGPGPDEINAFDLAPCYFWPFTTAAIWSILLRTGVVVRLQVASFSGPATSNHFRERKRCFALISGASNYPPEKICAPVPPGVPNPTSEYLDRSGVAANRSKKRDVFCTVSRCRGSRRGPWSSPILCAAYRVLSPPHFRRPRRVHRRRHDL